MKTTLMIIIWSFTSHSGVEITTTTYPACRGVQKALEEMHGVEVVCQGVD